ncbi:hypothetical protein SI65_03987 [Aspergillus cristatus]|uniref:Zn(2)-C6 fungal-type domain-containing protein n=1 Tax=Aspergillus cristatus TaxID=573508 RepID=A0A1E3BJ07_ASPCR|nr:hypothetical protein SI65_03987 [Aspergillus cristatus]
MEPEEPESEPRETLDTRRACDQCRLRKIRCDKRTPCANCRTSKIVCRSTGAGQKPPEPRRRVLISSQYEQKIDLIEERLASIEDALRDLKSTITSRTSSNNSPTATPTSRQIHITPTTPGYPSRTTTTAAALDHHESSRPFEGNSSMAAHSAYASEFLETAVSQSALQVSSPRIGAALSTLKQIVSMQDHQAHPSSSREVRLPNQKAIRGTGLQDLAMPPMELVLRLCRWVKESPPTIFEGYFPFISVDKFVQKCREVYFAIDQYSDATFIVVNGGLYNVFIEWSFITKDHETREECQKYLSLCRKNLETALVNLNLLMPARAESIEALALGAIHAIEISKPSFAWTLTSTAARLCQTLGYHRASSMEHDTPSTQQDKMGLFWSIYCLDKALSLRLGRSSAIQDYDISLPMNFESSTVVQPWKTIHKLWIRLASIQGKVYEFLYSPAALAQPEEDRVSHARQLAEEMQCTVMDPFKKFTTEHESTFSKLQDYYLSSDRVSRFSVLTLIYRAIPPPPDSPSAFTPHCIETARAALQAHQDCMISIKESNEILKCSYMHWTIFYAPFIPFIVLICHILEVPIPNPPSPTSPNQSSASPAGGCGGVTDLSRLTDFVLSLRPLTAHSEAIANLHRLCQVLCSVAKLYVEAKAQAARGQSSRNGGDDEVLASVGQEFDVYLSALGLAPPGVGDGAVDGGGSGSDAEGTGGGMSDVVMDSGVSQTTQLGNWFSGNQYMMGLLEEDLSLIDFSGWS